MSYCDLKNKKKKANARTKKWLADGSLDEKDFLPYRFSPTKWPINRKENLLITRGPRAEIEPRQPIGGSRATRRSNRVAINQLDPGHERNLLLLTPLSPSPLRYSTLYSRAHEITSRFVNYRDQAVSLYLSDKRLRRITRDGLSNISNRIAVSRKTDDLRL